MKRPLACVGFGVLAAEIALTAFPISSLNLLAACIALAGALFAWRRFLTNKDENKSPENKRVEKAAALSLFLLSAAVGSVIYFCADSFLRMPLVNEFGGNEVTFSGRIVSIPYTEGTTTKFTVETSEINGENRKLRILVYSSTVPDADEFDYIDANAVLSPIKGSSIDFASYCTARNIFFSAYLSPYTKTYYTVTKNEEPSFERSMAAARRYACGVFKKALSSSEASICSAVLTGDRSSIPDDVSRRFNVLGVAHVTVVSGLHLSLVAGIVLFIVYSVTKLRRISALCALITACMFAAFAGFGFSVRRALVMTAIMLIAQLSFSHSDTLNTLGLAALILGFDPFAAGDVGLLWSFSCTLSIILLAERIKAAIGENLAINGALSDMISVTIAAFVGSLPIMLLVTKVFSLYAILVSMLIAPAAVVILACGGAGVIFAAVGLGVLSPLALLIAGLSAKYMIFLTKRIYELPLSKLSVTAPAVVWWFAVSALMIAALYIFGSGRLLKYGAAFSVASLGAIFCISVFLYGSDITLSLCDVGEGLTAVLKYDDCAAVLCAYGEKRSLSAAENEFDGVNRLTCAVDITPQEHGYDYGRLLSEKYRAETVITDDHRKNSYAWYEYIGGEVRSFNERYTLNIESGGKVEIVSDGSMMCEYLTLNGSTVLLADGEGEIPKRFRDVDLAVLTDDTHFDELSDDAMIIISNCGKQFYDSRIIGATNGEGTLCLRFHKRSDMTVSRK